MNIILSILLVAAILVTVHAVPKPKLSNNEDLNQVSRKKLHDYKSLLNPYVPGTKIACRLFQGPSRCVDEAINFPDKEPWCPYRVCGPSFIPAEKCPAYDLSLQATNLCTEEVITRDIYKCDGKEFGSMYLPVNCDPSTEGCKDTPMCSCVKVEDVTTKVYSLYEDYTPYCGKSVGRKNPGRKSPE